MKKLFCILFSVLLLSILCFFVGCSKSKEEDALGEQEQSFNAIQDGTPITIVPQQNFPFDVKTNESLITIDKIDLAINNFNEVPNIYQYGVYLYKLKIDVSGKYEGNSLDEKSYISPIFIFFGQNGVTDGTDYYCADKTDFKVDKEGNFVLSGYIYTNSQFKHYCLKSALLISGEPTRYSNYSVKVIDNNGDGISGVGIQLALGGYDKSKQLWNYHSITSEQKTDQYGIVLTRFVEIKESVLLIVKSVPNGYVLPKEPVVITSNFNNMVISIEGGKLSEFSEKSNYDQAIDMFKYRNPLYVSFDFNNGITQGHIEWYENDREILMNVPSTLNPKINETYYIDKENDNIYFVDRKLNKLIKTEEQLFMWSNLFYINGTLVEEVSIIDNKEFYCLSFMTEDIKLKYVKENDSLKTIILEFDDKEYKYDNFVLLEDLPLSSELCNVNELQPSSYIDYIVKSSSMSPALEIGHRYYFDRIDDISKLKVGDIILVKYDFGEEEKVLNAHRIIEIINEEGRIGFILKGDNVFMRDVDTYYQEDVVGLLVD